MGWCVWIVNIYHGYTPFYRESCAYIHIFQQIDGKGLRLRDLDVRGDCTATLLSREDHHPVSPFALQYRREITITS